MKINVFIINRYIKVYKTFQIQIIYIFIRFPIAWNTCYHTVINCNRKKPQYLKKTMHRLFSSFRLWTLTFTLFLLIDARADTPGARINPWLIGSAVVPGSCTITCKTKFKLLTIQLEFWYREAILELPDFSCLLASFNNLYIL